MTLYEILGLVAMSAGLAGAIGYEAATRRPLIPIAAAVVMGVMAGVIVFLRLGRIMIQLKQPTERTLAILYVLTFLGILLATWAAAFVTLSIAGSFNR